MPDKTPELLPCPFCGSVDVVMCPHLDDNLAETGLHYIHCNTCWIDTASYSKKEHVVEKWNRRTQPKPEPLTLRQLQAEWRNGSPVYAQNMDNTKINRRSGVWCVMLVHGRRINK